MEKQKHIKFVTVTNEKNVLVQVPSFVASVMWQLKDGDILEMTLSEDKESIIIKPKVRTGSDVDYQSPPMA